tara:strand:+ start:280 stop:618 length:339 start_codon:yes stop_codon:yes gene_type:complete
LFLNSLVTGPKILVPTGSPLSSTKTAALLSNFTLEPSSLCIPFLTLTTTALCTDPFLTLPFGIASFTAITIVSPILAYLLLDPPNTLMHSIFLLLCYQQHLVRFEPVSFFIS